MSRSTPERWDQPAPFSDLTRLELAWGNPLGTAPDVAPLQADPSMSARDAFRAIARAALRRPPCVVSFSGGRDSSVVLAIATDVARREGLPLPIPFTHRFPEVKTAHEDDWQELVVRHLNLPDWQVSSWTDEMDVIGPIAQRSFAHAGATSPPNAHFVLPVLERARGGSVLTGIEGDELFELRIRPVATRYLYGPDRGALRDLPGFLAGLRPRRLSAARMARSHPLDYPWIRDSARHEIERRFSQWLYEAPLRYDRALLQWHWPSRTVQHLRAHQASLARRQNAVIEHPFGAATFLSALAAEVGPTGPSGRARLLRTLAHDLLPNALFTRTGKAGFGQAFYSRHTRAFAASWDGAGVDESIVDVEALRAQWLAPRPAPQSLVLLQTAFLAQAQLGEQPGGPRVDGGKVTGTAESQHGNRDQV